MFSEFTYFCNELLQAKSSNLHIPILTSFLSATPTEKFQHWSHNTKISNDSAQLFSTRSFVIFGVEY